MRTTSITLLTVAVLLLARSSSATVIVTSSPGFGLAQSGGDGPLVPSGVVPNNLALSSNGSTAFAIDVISPYPAHLIAHLNDGVYGNPNSWIGNTGRNITLTDPSSGNPTTVNTGFAGIAAPATQLFDISSFAFGRDNLGNDNGGGGQFTDRTAGTYYVQVTTAANPNASTADGSWTTVGSINLSGTGGDSDRHDFTFSSPVLATGLRIVVPSVGLPTGTDIDEIEINGRMVPEPSTFVLGGLGLVGLMIARRRRK